jgi:hypothetical protein
MSKVTSSDYYEFTGLTEFDGMIKK